jgi:outer membrane protein assembly factor BamB
MTIRFLARAARGLPIIALVAAGARAGEFSDQRLANWHQWRGPEATGFAPHGDPPVRWDEQTNVKWKVPIPGHGTSTPVIWGDRIFLLTAIKTDRLAEPLPVGGTSGESDGGRTRERERPGHFHEFVVLCLDRNTGGILWQKVAREVVPHQGHHNTSSFVASSPVTDGGHVHASFGSRGVYCYDMEGNEQWSASLGQFEIKYGFGEGSSPALHEDTLVVNCDHEGDSFITALDAATGRPRWRAPSDENSTWNTPLVTEYDGRVQVIVNGARSARAYDLATGDLIWKHAGPAGVDAIPSPLRAGDLAIFMGGFRGSPAFAVPLDATGELTDTDDIAWKHAQGTP